MKIVSAEFIGSAAQPSQFPREFLPEIAFVGRSNVGKSSLINNLLRQKGLARTSSTPGRTQQINFFRINQSFFFVDFPGYGYAKVPQALRASWRDLIESYFQGRKQLTHCVLIVDSRIGPSELDLERAAWFQSGPPDIDKPAATRIAKDAAGHPIFEGGKIVHEALQPDGTWKRVSP